MSEFKISATPMPSVKELDQFDELSVDKQASNPGIKLQIIAVGGAW